MAGVQYRANGWWRACVAACLAAVSGVSLGAGDERIALVIGNGAYRGAPLKNPVYDALAVASSLRTLGFDVLLRENTSQKETVEALREFMQRASRSQVRMLYYAGHGVQIKGKNYLLPVDVDPGSEEDIVQRGADVSELMDRFAAFREGVNLIVLDACRSNPLSGGAAQLADSRRVRTRGIASQSGGLAPVQAPGGTLVAYSTAPGAVAIDDPGQRNSVYTRHLLAQMRVPGVPVERMFKQVRIGVAQDTQQQQTPWESSSLVGDFCLRADAMGRCGG